MATYKFYYFPIKGLGELPRYMFTVANQKFDDNRVEYSEWAKMKADPDRTLFGQVPILIVQDGEKEFKIAQSNTIARFLARRFNLAGKNELEITRAEMVLDLVQEFHAFFKAVRMAQLAKDEQLQKQRIVEAEAQLPKYLSNFERLLENQKTKYLAGDELTVADIALAVFIDRYERYIHDGLDKYPLLKAINNEVSNLPSIVAYKTNRPTSVISIE